MSFSFDFYSIFFGTIFGVVGWGALRYGRAVQSGRHIVVGLLLMGYAYFIPGAWLTFFIGLVLTGLLFVPI